MYPLQLTNTSCSSHRARQDRQLDALNAMEKKLDRLEDRQSQTLPHFVDVHRRGGRHLVLTSCFKVWATACSQESLLDKTLLLHG